MALRSETSVLKVGHFSRLYRAVALIIPDGLLPF